MLEALWSSNSYFAASFAEARTNFARTCERAGLPWVNHHHPQRGPGGEELATTVARMGSLEASKLAIVISGTHGLEGLAGSGGQIAWLAQRQTQPLEPDTAVLLIHLLNPWGCAWGRRQTEDNVDLNRNFANFGADLPHNNLYEIIHQCVMEGTPGSRASGDPTISAARQQMGDKAFAAALQSGQYRFAVGAGYGGKKLTWSARTLDVILDRHATTAQHTAVIDIHTGLGLYGQGSLLTTLRCSSAAYGRLKDWYGPGIMGVNDDPEAAYTIQGDLLSWAAQRLPDCLPVALEFGTFEIEHLLNLQIDDLRRHVKADWSSPGALRIRADLQNFFYPATRDWLQSVAMRSVRTIELGLAGLSRL